MNQYYLVIYHTIFINKFINNLQFKSIVVFHNKNHER